jgi:NADH dehydrogenase
MATVGRSRAIAQIQRIHLSGFLAWLAWLLVHLVYLVGFKNRLIVLITWAWSYFTYGRGARLITGTRLPQAERLIAANVQDSREQRREEERPASATHAGDGGTRAQL